MVLKVLAFGIAKDIVGGQTVQLDAADAATVAKLKDVLKSKYPALGELSSLMIAVNSKYAKDSQQLNPNDEIAIIPPTNGG